MKVLHRPDLFGWSRFDEARDIDFHSLAWVGAGDGAILVDPLPLSAHDRAHLEGLCKRVRAVVVTNSDHLRSAREIAALYKAPLLGPAAEQAALPCDGWLADGDEIAPGLTAIALEGSKTPGELALLLEETTLITGDLIRAHAGGRLHLLPDPKLEDKAKAIASVQRLAELPQIDAVIVGDGWPIFRGGKAALEELLASLG